MWIHKVTECIIKGVVPLNNSWVLWQIASCLLRRHLFISVQLMLNLFWPTLSFRKPIGDIMGLSLQLYLQPIIIPTAKCWWVDRWLLCSVITPNDLDVLLESKVGWDINSIWLIYQQIRNETPRSICQERWNGQRSNFPAE